MRFSLSAASKCLYDMGWEVGRCFEGFNWGGFDVCNKCLTQRRLRREIQRKRIDRIVARILVVKKNITQQCPLGRGTMKAYCQKKVSAVRWSEVSTVER